jgi:hypothetical protein
MKKARGLQEKKMCQMKTKITIIEDENRETYEVLAKV